MLNKAKIRVASVGFRIFKKFKQTQQTAKVFTSPSASLSPTGTSPSTSPRGMSPNPSPQKVDSTPDSDSTLPNSGNSPSISGKLDKAYSYTRPYKCSTEREVLSDGSISFKKLLLFTENSHCIVELSKGVFCNA